MGQVGGGGFYGGRAAREMRRASGLPGSRVLVEPRRRNTAMAVAWAALRIRAEDPDALICSVLELARLHESAGRTEEALEYWNRLLISTRSGDQDLPQVLEAKEAVARLTR